MRCKNPKNPRHDAVKEEKGCRLARGKSWMGQAERLIQHVCGLTELKQVRGWGKCPVKFKPYYETLLPVNLGTHCPERPAGKTIAEVQALAEANSKSHDIVIYTDGSKGAGLVGGSQSSKMEGLYTKTVVPTESRPSSLTTETEAVTRATQWVASQLDKQITNAIILEDSMNILQETKSGMGCPDWHTAMRGL